jgi:hypothetical protein
MRATPLRSDFILSKEERVSKSRIGKIIEVYVSLLKTHKNYPTYELLKTKGISEGVVKYNFGNLSKLKAVLLNASPNLAKSIKTQSKEQLINEELNRILKAGRR